MSGAGRPDLTVRQWRILGLLADGQSATAIARAFGVQVSEIRGQLVAIYRRLPLAGAADRPAAAVAWYREHGAGVGAPPARPGVVASPREVPILAPLPDLTPVQGVGLERLARGESRGQIARNLGLAPGKVNAHIHAIYQQLRLGRGDKRAADSAWYLGEGRQRRQQEEGS